MMCGPPPDEYGKDLTKEFFNFVREQRVSVKFTKIGKEILKSVKDIIEKNGLLTQYADTDSIGFIDEEKKFHLIEIKFRS